MKTSFLALSIVFLCAFSATASESIFSKITLEESLLKARDNNKLIFVNYTADWSDSHVTKVAKYFEDERIKNALSANYIPVEANYSDPDSKVWFSSFRVTDLPTFLILDENGKIIDRHEGDITISDFLQFLSIEQQDHKGGLVSDSIPPANSYPDPAAIEEEVKEEMDETENVIEQQVKDTQVKEEIEEIQEDMKAESIVLINGKPSLKMANGGIITINGIEDVPDHLTSSYENLIAKESGGTGEGSFFTVVRQASKYTIQVGAFSNEKNVVKLMDKINAAYPSANAYIVRDNNNPDIFKLCVGEFGNEQEAESGKSQFGTYTSKGFVRPIF